MYCAYLLPGAAAAVPVGRLPREHPAGSVANGGWGGLWPVGPIAVLQMRKLTECPPWGWH